MARRLRSPPPKASTRRENGANGAKKRRTETLEAAHEQESGPAAESSERPYAEGINLIEEDAYREVKPGEGIPPEGVAMVNRARAFAAMPVTMSLQDVCEALGVGDPDLFTHEALQAFADHVETLAHAGEHRQDLPPGEPFRSLLALRGRSRLEAFALETREDEGVERIYDS